MGFSSTKNTCTSKQSKAKTQIEIQTYTQIYSLYPILLGTVKISRVKQFNFDCEFGYKIFKLKYLKTT